MPNWKKLIVSGSDANLNSLDITADNSVGGLLKVADGSNSAPSITFTDDTDTGIYRSTDNTFNVTVGGTNMFAINSSGITSGANVYSGTNGQFRNYAGVWKATTGTTGNGFNFTSADLSDLLTISSTGNAVFKGNIKITDTTGTRGVFRNNTSYDLRLGGGTVYTDGAYISLSGGTRGGGTSSSKGRVEIFSGGSNFSAQADITGDILIGAQWNGGTSNIIVLDSSTNNATFAGNATFNGDVDADDVTIDTWGSVSASLATLTQNQIDGSGTANYVARFSDTNTLTTGLIQDDGSSVGIATGPGAKKLTVGGTAQISGELFFTHFDQTSTNASRFRDDTVLRFGTNRIFGIKYNSTADQLQFVSSSNVSIGIDGTGNTTFAGSIHLDNDSSQLQFGDDNDMQIYHNGANGEINNTLGNFKIDSAGDITLDADGGDIRLYDGGVLYGNLANGTGHFQIKNPTQDMDILFQGNDGGNTITALQLDMSEGGNATFAGDVTVEGTLTAQEFHTELVSASIVYQSGSTKFGDTSDDIHSFSGSLRVTGSGDHYFTHGNVGIGVTSPGHILDVSGNIRVQGGNRKLIFNNGSVEASIDQVSGATAGLFTLANVGIGTSSPTKDLVVNSDTGGEVQTQYQGSDKFRMQADSGGGSFYSVSGAYTRFHTSGVERLRITSDGNVGIMTASPSHQLSIGGTASGKKITMYLSSTDENYSAVGAQRGESNLYCSSEIRFINESNSSGTGAVSIATGNNTLYERFRISSGGALKFNSYGSGNHTGTLAYSLGVDSSGNIIEFTGGSGGGTVSSITSGADNRVAVFSGTDSLEGDADFTFDGANVGIGTTSPAYKLDIRNADSSGINISGASSYIRWNTGDMQIRNAGSYAMAFDTWTGSSLTEKMRITSDGNVGIGTSTPDTKLDVLGNIRLNTVGNELQFSNHNVGAYRDSNNRLVLSGYGGIHFRASNTAGMENQTLALRIGTDGRLTSNTLDSYRYNVATNQAISFGYSDRTLAMPLNGYLWHDLLGFDYNYTKTQEISTDGSSFSSHTLDKGLFAQKQDQSIEVISSSEVAARWTFQGVAWSVADWMNIAFSYVSNDISKDILIESSADGSSWTTRHTSTVAAGISTKTCYISAYSGDTYLRLTISKNNTSSTNAIKLSSIKLMTARAGDQGQGMEYQFPYTWDYDRRIAIGHTPTTGTYEASLAIKGKTADSTASSIVVRNSSNTSLFSVRNDGRIDVPSGAIVHGGGGYANTSTDDSYFTGKLGIGTTTPQRTLDVNGEIQNNGIFRRGGNVIIKSTGSETMFGPGGSGIITFHNSATMTTSDETIRIDANGNLLLNNTSAGARLDIREDSNYAIQAEDASGHYFRVNTGGDVDMRGDLVVQGTITAQEFHTEFVSASILYDSGSTKFGDTSDDNHDFTGSVNVSGSVHLSDSSTLKIGDASGGDLQLYHDGSNSVINNTTGNLQLYNNADDGDIQFISDNGSGGTAEYFRVDGGATKTIVSKAFQFFDSVNLEFGDSSDLQIFHNSADTWFDNYTGNINFRNRQDDGDIIFYSDDGSGGHAEYFRVDGGVEKNIFSKPVTVTGGIDADDITIDDWGSVSASLASIQEAGGVNGGGASTRVAYWSDGDTLTSDADFSFTAATNTLGLTNTATNGKSINVTDGTSWLGIVPSLGSGGYTGLSAAGDIGLIFSIDNDNTTDSTTNGLLIAPHTQTSGGLKILENGNVGIGTSSPSYQLDVGGTSRIAGTIHMYGAVRNYSGDFSLQNGVQDADILFKVNDGGTTTTAMMVDGATSNVGIGTSSPLVKLDIDGVLYSRGGTWNGGGSESDYTVVGAVIQEGHFIFTKDGDNLRKLIGKTSDIVEIGQAGTSLIDGISFLSGTTPLYKWYSNNSELMKLDSNGLELLDSEPVITLTDTRNLNVDDWDDVSLGKIEFKTSDTTSPGARVLSEIQAYSSTAAASGPESELRFKTSTTTDSTPQTRLTIGAEGNVGIGTTNPAYILQTRTSGDTVAAFQSTDNKARILIQDDDTNGYFGAENGVVFMGHQSGTHVNNIAVKSTGDVGIGETSPLTRLHVKISDTAGTKTNYGKVLIEDTDAHLDMLSTSDGTWGSSINFIEATGSGANKDVWSIARKTTAGDGDSSLNFNFGTSNQHDNTNRIQFSSTGNLKTAGNLDVDGTGISTIAGDLTVAGTLTAQEFHTEFVSASIIYESGSTKFGDTSDDVHDFTGSVNVKSLSTGAKLTIEDDTAKTELQHNLHAFRIKVDPDNADSNSNFRVEIDGSEKLRIDNDGDVGIGTTSPATTLDVYGTSDTYLTVRNSGGGNKAGIRMYGGSAGISHIWHDDTETNPPGIHFGTSADTATTPTTQLYIKGSNGNVGIGTSSPGKTLHVAGEISGSAIQVIGGSSTNKFYSTNTGAIAEFKPSDTRSGMQPIFLYRSTVTGTANYMLASGGTTLFGLYDSGVPSDLSGMVRITPNNSSEAPAVRIGDAGSNGAYLDIGGNIKLLNNGNSYINGGNVGIGTSSPGTKLHVSDGTFKVQSTSSNNRGVKITPNGEIEQVSSAADWLHLQRNHNGKVAIGADSTADLHVYNDLLIDTAKISYQENTDVDSAAAETIATVTHASYDAAFFDYVVKNGTNLRAGTVMAVHDGTNVEFTDNSTKDIGTTSGVTFSVDISGTDLRLRATTTTDNWTIKTLVRTL